MKARLTPLLMLAASIVCSTTTAGASQPPEMIAFATNRALNLNRGAIYSVREDGTGRRLVALPAPPTAGFVRSLDGSRIVFRRRVDGVWAIFVARRTGANAVRLTPADPDVSVGGPVFSPNGRRIAYVSTAACNGCGARSAVHVVNVDGTGRRQVVEGGGSPSWSPNGRRLAYVDGRDVNIVNLRGGQATRVGAGTRPVWAPRGDRIAYLSTLGGYEVLCIAHADGSRRRCALGRTARDIVWSPDATHVAFRQLHGRLLIVNLDARVVRAFSYRETASPSPRAWSPDGRAIAYVYSDYPRRGAQLYVRSVSGRSTPKRLTRDPRSSYWDVRWRAGRITYVAQRFSNDHEIAVMSPEGHGVRLLTHNRLLDLEPDWSPDRRTIVFWRRDGESAGLRLISADGSSERALTLSGEFWDQSPVWSPDGLRIAFVRTRRFSRDARLMLIERDGNGLRELSGESIYASGITWSPDGRFLAGTVGADLFVIGADGSGFRRLQTGGVGAVQPAWSPDGKRILFTGAGGLFTIRPDGSGRTAVVANAESGAWSPEGNRILFARTLADPPLVRNLFVTNADGTGEAQLTRTYSSNIDPAWSR